MTTIELDAYLRKRKVNEDPAYVSDRSRNDNMLGTTLNSATFTTVPGENIKITQHGRYLPVPEHGHDYFEMMYVYDGSITQYINGEKIVLDKGAICLLDINAKHSTDIAGENDIAVNFILQKAFFDPTFFLRIEDNSLFSDFFANAIYRSESFGRYIVIHTHDNKQVRDYAAALMCEYYDPDICSKGIVESLIPIIFNELFRVWRDSGGKKVLHEPDGTQNVWRILRFIQTNHATATLTSTAHRFGYASNYLSTLLARTTGQNFTEIRHAFCMEQASLMLMNSGISIGDIAQSVGFSNISFFYSLFHRSFGMTPAEYREKSRKQATQGGAKNEKG